MSFGDVLKQLAGGFGNTCLLFLITLVCALPLGLIISFGSMSKFKPLKAVTKAFVWVIRGTPLMLQVIIIFYIPGMYFGVPFKSRLFAASIAFVLNYACSQIFVHVTLMQVIKRILAPMGNEVITLVKDTSLAKVIMVTEIIHAAENVQKVYGVMWPLFAAGAFYLVFNGLLSLLFAFAEKKLAYYRA